ncbi:helix-turn-helix transcriptional regulator [Roseibium marinum]|uniref:AraC-like DNA-binding protein n=1 Tax=Roseibium marinum TaxID=281252 RepID=A0A2S3US23_9HYPH|nr:AraC family transcriptional regulator [Roseibium marinum]POF30486.1 AraC-like DNA-binding protein [Roseibium marinum]
MDDPALVSFPLPMLTALLCSVLALLVWRLELGPVRANALFSAFFALGAVSAYFVALRFGYGFDALIPLQRTLPLFVAPLLYLGFASMTVEKRDLARSILFHLGAPFIAMGLFWLLAEDLRALDWLISASYAVYALALYLLWRKGPDALIFARVDMTRSLSNWILRGIGFLIFLLLLDTAIAVDFAVNRGSNVARLISYGTVPLILLLLAALVTLPLMFSRSRAAAQAMPAPEPEDAEVEARLRTLMDEQQLFLDPDLTVQRLARRLHLPARSLSAAINRTQGSNVSQYVNTFRLAHAARLLVEADDSVTRIAVQSGFMTRSNFYREFQRVYGQSPTEYRLSARPEREADRAGPEQA